MENFLIIMNVIFINTLLSSDNAVAVASLVLPLEPVYWKKAIRWGAVALVFFLVAIAAAANSVMAVPGVKVVGATLLYWIALRLLIRESREDQKVRRSFDFGRSVVTVVVSIVAVDIATSLDNVLAIISAAKGNMFDVGVGILVSIPMILWGSERIARFLERFPQLIRMGGCDPNLGRRTNIDV
ncbi:TerC family protein [Kyrpidia spormannii]|uniref:Uncharacterized protein n=2 Tax=Kyrpidia spormannii TaxID=2055160 RepID=A0ACA8Z5A1_9BACL|nr:hypothetical protein [Kyrpidia spormannii]CAB3389438.1 membrane protein of unknown function [Kyrpidia spormannii]CAB3390160.1 membrane protein of unknown function [Kyrpidia spormannii]